MSQELINLIQSKSKQLLEIKQRYFFLCEFNLQLGMYAGDDQRFPVINMSLYDLVKRYEDSLVVDLASWSTGMRANFFNKIKNNCKGIVKYKHKTEDYPTPSIRYLNYTPCEKEMVEHRKRMKKEYFGRMKDGTREIIEELFPDVGGRSDKSINHSDIDKLCKQFLTITSRVIEDRDTYRAHKYEMSKDEQSNYTPITIDEIGKTFKGIEDLLNKLRVMVKAESFAYIDVFQNHDAVQNIIDNMLFGGDSRISLMLKVEHIGKKQERLKKLRKSFREYVNEHNSRDEDFKDLFWVETDEN
ncbi:MAG: hypothetical protein HOO06_16405 [Bdellovibrionaceae bacterium]|jgi:hypothetical protein|nr:hypothetical protein [Pseudobdellovibrionaceae bacterium]